MNKRCLICEKAIEADDVAVRDATIWTSRGNFGSTVYDPVDGGSYLEALLCDECLRRKKGLIEEVVVRQVTEVVERHPPDF